MAKPTRKDCGPERARDGEFRHFLKRRMAEIKAAEIRADTRTCEQVAEQESPRFPRGMRARKNLAHLRSVCAARILPITVPDN